VPRSSEASPKISDLFIVFNLRPLGVKISTEPSIMKKQ